MLNKFRQSTLGRSSRLLTKKERQKVLGVVVLQVLLGFMDLVAVAIVGVLGALAVNGVQSKEPGNRVSMILQILSIENFSFRTQMAILGVGAATILVLRTFLSVYFSRKILYFLSYKTSALSSRLFSRLIQEPLLVVRSKSSQELLFALTAGITSVTMGILGTVAILISDFSILIIIAVGLFILDPILALSTIVLFSTISWILYRLLNKKAQDLGERNAFLQVQGNSKILEIISAYREAVVTHRRVNYSLDFKSNRYQLADTIAELSFMPNISKYVIESALVIGALTLAAVQFILKDASNAVAMLAVFMAAGARIAPAVMRIQQGAVSIKGSIGSATPTLNLIDEFIHEPTGIEDLIQDEQKLNTMHNSFIPEVCVDDVSLKYPSAISPALNSVSMRISPGTFVALVGPSGAGKTSLVDVLLGILPPSSGQVRISKKDPLEAFSIWPGAVAYLPQDTEIFNGTIRENLCLGLNPKYVSDANIWDALEKAQLREFVESLPKGLDSSLGEKGMKMSGGQRQRLGISRALLSKPLLVVLDEATSSLDGETESKVTESFLALKGGVTFLMIAHRLSTIRQADCIYFMDKGQIVASGTFEELKREFPKFAENAQLMGL